MNPEDSQEVKNWLQGRGYSPDEIDKIMARIEQFDEETMHKSVFDSIATGGFDLEGIIKDALGDEPQ